MKRLVTIIREDLSPGYQIAQTVHVVAEYTMMNPELIKEWYTRNNYVLSLSVKNKEELTEFATQLHKLGVKFNIFYEPDINEMTSVAFISTDETDIVTKNMPLAGKSTGNKSVKKVER